ncbi:MAG TPA: zinc ribbon domain-containing protein [bacterium]|nr:zinc ribbon domain-containing protein [bacterium]HPQ67361.1 zinc ribbon domain-containing protein [bacterium]
MPIYEYECRKCRHRFSHLSRTASAPAPRCPACGEGRPLKKLSTFNAAAPASNSSSGGSCSTGCCSL